MSRPHPSNYIFWQEYDWVISQDTPGYTKTSLDSICVAVRLKNNSSRGKRVTYKISAREQFSVGRAAWNVWEGGLFGLIGAGVAVALDEDPAVGAALGAGAAAAMQHSGNRWFDKQ